MTAAGINDKYRELEAFLQNSFSGDYLINEPLAPYTYYKIGGPADFIAFPRDINDLINLSIQCRALSVQSYVLGEGANVLVNDDGFRGVIINLTRYINSITVEGNRIKAGSGALLQKAILCSEQSSLGGLEYLSGIPGTIGGALIMNAGTHKGEIGECVRDISLMTNESQVQTLDASQITFLYRNVPEIQDKILLGCTLELRHENKKTLKERRLEQLKQRKAKQPLEYPSCGSVFKRPPGYYVGKMVEDLGLKGFRYGGAMISEKHGGFIVNLGTAKASDIKTIIETVQQDVFNAYHIELEPEVRLVGF